MPIARCGTDSGAIESTLRELAKAPRPRAIASATQRPSALEIAIVVVAASRLTRKASTSAGDICPYQWKVRVRGGKDSIAESPTEAMATNRKGAIRKM